MFGFLRKKVAGTTRIYLDHAAATPTRPEVVAAMAPYLGERYGNPSAIHTEGRVAKKAVDEARAEVARTLGIKTEGVVFTSGGTEGNALAIVGYCVALHRSGRAYTDMEIISTAIEHPSVSEALDYMRSLGVLVRMVPVDGEGKVLPQMLAGLLSEKSVLVTVAYVNSEIGVIQPVHSLARVVRAHERKCPGVRVVLHVDAAQAPLWLSCQLPPLDADMMTIDGGKCGGPKGSGVLALRKDIALVPVLWGGGQERGRRPGTENVPSIVGIATALTLAQASWKERAHQVARVRDRGIELLCGTIPGAVLNGPVGQERVANNLNISLLGVDTEYAVVVLDAAGIAASTKSACAGAGSGESVVVMAIAGDAARARSTLRLTLGEETTTEDFAEVAEVLQKLVALMSTVAGKEVR